MSALRSRQAALLALACAVALRASAAQASSSDLNFTEIGSERENEATVAVSAPQEPAPETTTPTMSSMFDAVGDGYSAATVDAVDVVATTAPPVPTTSTPPLDTPSNWTLSTVSPFGGDSNTTENEALPVIEIITDVASVAFSALPASTEFDIQGYPFASRAIDNNAEAAVNKTDEGWWKERVCSASPNACALVPTAHDRRLASATDPPQPGSLESVESALRDAAIIKTASSLVMVAAAFASGPFGLVLGAFAFVLCTLFASSVTDAYIALLKSVNSEYQELNTVIQNTGDRLVSGSDLFEVRRQIGSAIKHHNRLRNLAGSPEAKKVGWLGAQMNAYCTKHITEINEFKNALFKVTHVKDTLKAYFESRSTQYVGEAVHYLKGLYMAYSTHTKCELALKNDLETIKTNDKALRGQLSQAANDMAAAAAKMRSDFATGIVTEATDGIDRISEANLEEKYDWLKFKIVKSKNNVCSQSLKNFVDSSCGLVMVSEDTCTFLAWYSKDSDAGGGQVVYGTDLYKQYNDLPAEWRCGYGSEEDTIIDNPGPPERLLVGGSSRMIPSFTVYVRAKRSDNTPPPTVPSPPESVIDKSTADSYKDPLQDQLNQAKDEKERMKIIADNYNSTSAMSQSIKSRDMAVWFALETDLKIVNDMYKERNTMVDSISQSVKDVHEIEMGRIDGIYKDLEYTGEKEIQALDKLQVQTTGQHNEELATMDGIDNQLNLLSDTLDKGFSGTSSDIDSVERDTTAALNQLGGTVQTAGAKTRAQVKQVIEKATQNTLAHLDGLDNLIATKAAEKLGAVRGLNSLVENAAEQLKNGVANEFNARAQQLQERVAGLTDHVATVGAVTANTLITASDAMRTELGRRLAFMTTQLEVIDGRITETEKMLDTINTQVDDILRFVGSINARLTGVFRTLRDLPNRIRQVVMVNTVEGMFRDGERLGFAYSNYIKHGMNQLQAFEFIQQCDAVGEALLFDNLVARLTRGEAVLQRELAMFNNSRVDYEQFGNRIAAAAYHLRYMLVPCANMRTLKMTGRAEFTEVTSRMQADKLASSIWTFQQSMEETVPQIFLKKIYTAAYLQTALADARNSVGSTTYALAAIEPLRYQIQQQIGAYAAVSVIQPDMKSKLTVWTKGVKVSIGMSRHGALRLSTLSSSIADDNELLVLWSNTRQQIPTALRSRFSVPLKKTDLVSDTTMAAAFKGTVYEPFWTAGFIQSAVFVERVNQTCPWAITTASYPFCWETGSYNEGGCVCVQIEGTASPVEATAMGSNEGPTLWGLQTTFNGTTPRSNFLISAVPKASTTALSSTTMIGAPTNRRAFSLCMSSAKPPQECITSSYCHQPPPSFTRCIANPTETYNIVYPADNAAVFIKDGLSVTSEMFRTLEIGAGIPDITFFDSLNGEGGYIVCTDCSMTVLQSIYLFRVMSFKIGRPAYEKTAICKAHPRYSNVEFCTRGVAPSPLWTPQTLLQGELLQNIQLFGRSLPANITDPQQLAALVNARVQKLMGEDVAYFKVYVAKSGSFNATTNVNAYWSSLPTQEAAQERGWAVVSGLYSTISNGNLYAFDALVMWSTLPVAPRNFAKLVVDKKPAGQALKTYLLAKFAAYNQEKILRGYFSEPFDGLDCPVAGDTDHFAYCTPTPVDKICLCVQLEDLPEEYTELYDGSAPSGKVVSYVLDTDASVYVVGRSKGSFSLGDNKPTATWDGLPMRNVSDRSVCVGDYNHPELGASCVVDSSGATSSGTSLTSPATSSRLQVGPYVSSVVITAPTWTAQCDGCSSTFVSEISSFAGAKVMIATSGVVIGGSCQKKPADGGGQIQVCLNQNPSA